MRAWLLGTIVLAGICVGCDGSEEDSPGAEAGVQDLGIPDGGLTLNGSCVQLINQCEVVDGAVYCPTSAVANPVYDMLVECVGPTRFEQFFGLALECDCFGLYYPCRNASSTGGDGGYSQTFDGCGI